MANEQDASAAYERWREGRSYVQYGVKMHDEDDEQVGFLAGYEAGHDELRDKVRAVISAALPMFEAVRNKVTTLLE